MKKQFLKKVYMVSCLAASGFGLLACDSANPNDAALDSEGLLDLSSAQSEWPADASGISSGSVSPNENPQTFGASSSSVNSHEGPLDGEDPNMKAVDTPLPVASGFPVTFTEVSPKNANFKDNDGNDPAWLELYNTSDAPVDLKGIALTNDAKYPRRWTFGNAVIPAKSYMVVFMSGKNYPDYIPPSDSLNMVGSSCDSEVSSGSGGFGFDFGGMGGDWGGGFGGNMGDFGGGFGNMGGGAMGAPGDGGNMGGMGNTQSSNSVENLPGQSAICFNENGASEFGAVLRVPAGGSYSRLNISPNKTNLGNINQLVIRGFITKDHKIRVNFKENGEMSDWSGKNLRGTGDSSSVYYVRLAENAAGVNLTNVTATTFASETQGSELTTIKVTSFVARNRGHEPHTTFKADNKDGALYLVNEQNAILDSVHYTAVPVGASWSRSASGAWGLTAPSPYGNTVGEVMATQVDVNDVSIPSSGFYSQPISVTFPEGTRCENGGTEPTVNSPVVQSLQISTTTVLRCVTYREGSYPSDMINRTYVFETQPSLPVLFVTSDPLSLFSPDSGLYMTGEGASMMDPKKGANFWSNRELPVYVEFFEPKKSEPQFGVMGDYKITGAYSRAKEKKSFSVTMRETYGKKRLNYALFPEFPELTKFKSFTLRNNGNNSGNDYIRDMLGTSVTEGLGVDYMRGRPAIVFYNGKYYGIHGLRERNNEYYYETHYGLDPDDIDLVDMYNDAEAGSSTDYKAMVEWLNSNSLESDANYQKIAEQIDVDNYMNYMQSEMFLNNRDWPHNNLKKWRVASEKSKWKWFLYDTDFGFGSTMGMSNGNIFEYVTNRSGTSMMGFGGFNMGGGNNGGSISEHTILIIRLLENASFRNAFINRFATLLSMNFASDRLQKRLETLQGMVQSEMTRDQEFWNFSASNMEQELQKMQNFATSRQQTIRSEMTSFFNLGEAVQVTLSSQGAGTILVHNLPLDQASMDITFYKNVPVTVTAKANGSSVFTGWSDGSTEATRTFNPGEVTTLTAVFK